MGDIAVLQSPDKTVAGMALSKLYSFSSLAALLRPFYTSVYKRENLTLENVFVKAILGYASEINCLLIGVMFCNAPLEAAI